MLAPRRLLLVLLFVGVPLSSAKGKGEADLGDLGGLGALFGALGGQGKGAQGHGRGGTPAICSKKELIVPRPLKKLKKGVLVANGCGPEGMQVKEPYGLWRCCNRHDVCFGSCGTDAAFCERRYSACMKKRCQEKENAGHRQECDKQAQSFAGMSGAFGGGIHASSMPQVCDCAKTPEDATLKRREWISDLYRRFGPSDKADDAAYIDGLLEKYKGKEGRLYYELITKYGSAKGFVAFSAVPGSFDIEGPSDGLLDQSGPGQIPMDGSADSTHTEL